MPDRARLLADEATGATSLGEVFATIPSDRRDEPTVTDGWSPIIVAVHVAAWLEECARVLEAKAAGTWDPAAEPEETPASVDRMNADQAVRAAAMTLSDAEVAIAAARERARAALEALDTIDADAWSWFEESGPNHYAKHTHDLTAWLEGVRSDPEIGRDLQTEAEAWVAFARLLDDVPDDAHGRRNDEGWSLVDVCFHIAGWMNLAHAVIEHNAGWGAPWEPDAELSTDEINVRFLAGSRDRSFPEVRLGMDDARSRLRAAITSLPQPSQGAKEAFRESTIEHYEEHLPMLRRLTGSAGSVA